MLGSRIHSCPQSVTHLILLWNMRGNAGTIAWPRCYRPKSTSPCLTPKAPRLLLDNVTVIMASFSNVHQVTLLKITSDGISTPLYCLLLDKNRFIRLPNHRAELCLGLMQLSDGITGRSLFWIPFILKSSLIS